MDRRQFIGAAATALAAITTGCGHSKSATVVPREVLGGPGYVAPSDRLNFAAVGIGGMGHSDLTSFAKEGQNIVALCDVDYKYAERTFKEYPKATRYKDYRIMLEKEAKNIDAVIVATPDFMHAPISLMAMRMGKHVYCEKPLTHTVAEAIEMARVAREMKVATQMGNAGQAGEGWRVLKEYLMAGAIGKVREVHHWSDRPRGGGVWPQAIARPTAIMPVPKGLDWQLWLGVAPDRPYHFVYHPFRWRGWLDFGTGALGDMGCHAFHPIFKALDLAHPISVEAISTEWHEETFPLVSVVKFEFPARGPEQPPLTLTWYDGMIRPTMPMELERDRKVEYNDTLYVGDSGKMLSNRLIPEERHKEFPKPAEVLPRSIGHHKEFIAACKGGDPAGANFDFAALVTEVVLLGNIALRMQKKLEWDGEQQRFTNLPEANAFLTKTYRPGYQVL
ncbi:Gfo/Idh/MocA family oxidoreductase [bacterium]|nr:Gfo/Idh/MocA family oxidoreductase [bacterium]